jgi:uncharacterized membrane protein YphA (DoxX/SURF4 family)
MGIPVQLVIVVGFVLGLFLVYSSVSLILRPRATAPPEGELSRSTRFFLVALRLAIGWHIFVEAVDKVKTPTWSSEGYLREASGPLAPVFRKLGGDSVVERLTVGADKQFPEELDRDWQAYLDAFIEHYGLDDDKHTQDRAMLRNRLDQAKSDTLTWMTSNSDEGTRVVKKYSPFPPPLEVKMTVAQRLEYYQSWLKKAHNIEQKDFPTYGPQAFAPWKIAKAEAGRARSELKRDLDAQTVKMKEGLQAVIAPYVKTAQENVKKVRARYPTDPAHYTQKQQDEYKAALEEEIRWTTPVPEPAQRDWQEWGLREWTDNAVKWGLLGVGVCLLAGFLTRTACVVGALYLLLFYVAMPPLPSWPESPKAEGHYLYINKNVIEMLALLTLATTRSGRWCGLDGLLQFFNPWRWRSRSGNRPSSPARNSGPIPLMLPTNPEAGAAPPAGAGVQAAPSSPASPKEKPHGA